MKVSLEFIYHYLCDKCKQWWSVADIKPTPENFIICPHCGYHNKIEYIQIHSASNIQPQTSPLLTSMIYLEKNREVKMVAATESKPSTLTATHAVKLLKDIISDYNYWGESESDSPLTIKRTRSLLDDKKILSLDASMRSKASETEGYKAPERRIETKTLDEVFKRLVASSLLALEAGAKEVRDNGVELESLQMPAEAVEFYIQLYSAFKQLGEPKVCYVNDTASYSDPYAGLFIIGKSSDGETVFAQSLLIQT